MTSPRSSVADAEPPASRDSSTVGASTVGPSTVGNDIGPGGDPRMDLIRELPGLVLVVTKGGAVEYTSPGADDLRLVRRGQIGFKSLRDCASKTLINRTSVINEVTLRRPPLRKSSLHLRVHGIPLDHDRVVLLITDLTEESRLAAVRRDFIANVSHELKTPVGAMSLLSEAIVAARDDPEAVEHFAHRMQTESARLAQLINDVIDLSRVQGDDPLQHASVVQVDALVDAAVEFVAHPAELKEIQVVRGGDRGQLVYGDPAQLETALRNVMINAIAYSEPGTQVALAVRTSPHLVEIDVKDQGMGIPEAEIDRIFERFYRVDEARSRVTGGTGLGLAIVRNVCRNHGGDCLVWSVAGEGSTFTLQLPSYSADQETDPPEDQDQTEDQTEDQDQDQDQDMKQDIKQDDEMTEEQQ